MGLNTSVTWKPIKGFPDYLVSSDGRVKSLKKSAARELKTWMCRDYHQVNLRVKGVRKHFYVHRLVAEHYIPNPDKLPEVNHINEDKLDNRVENLEWCDRVANAKHSARAGKGLYKLGRPLNREEVVTIKDLLGEGLSSTKIAEMFGVSRSAIQHIRMGRTWRNI